MKQTLVAIILAGVCLARAEAGTNGKLMASAEALPPFAVGESAWLAATASETVPVAPAALPRMAPELALQTFEQRSARQSAELAAYSARTVIRAELPESAQTGEYELERHYSAPHTLEFKAVRFRGDGFVKNNVITRLLQSEVDHVQREEGPQTAITGQNYKFSYKGAKEISGREVQVFQLKPRTKRPGLFKGRVYLDAFTGSLVRAEGSVVKSPSFFVKRIEFVQEYEDVGGFTFPVHIHSEARARILGRAVVDIYHNDYHPVSSTVQAARQTQTP